MQGIDPASLRYAVAKVPRKHGSDPAVLIRDPEPRVRAVLAAEIEAQWGASDPGRPDSFTWERNWYHLNRADLRKVFDEQEIYKLWTSSVIMSDLTEGMKEDHPVLWKVSSSLWHFGCVRDLNYVADGVHGLQRIRSPFPGFNVRITFTRHFNPQGGAEHVDPHLYLDAPFGLLLYYGGKHVLTCGFAIAKEGVMVAQVQLRSKKGNRFLYKLPCHYVDFVLRILGEAFGHGRLWMVRGKSAVEAVRRAYGKNPCSITAEDAARIAAVYDRPLEAFDRSKKSRTREGRAFVRLRPKEDPHDAIRTAA